MSCLEWKEWTSLISGNHWLSWLFMGALIFSFGNIGNVASRLKMDGTWFQSYEGNFHFVYCVVVLVDSLLFTLTVTTALERFTATFSHSFSRPTYCLTQGRWVCWNISQLSHGQDGICALAWKAGPWLGYSARNPQSHLNHVWLWCMHYILPL